MPNTTDDHESLASIRSEPNMPTAFLACGIHRAQNGQLFSMPLSVDACGRLFVSNGAPFPHGAELAVRSLSEKGAERKTEDKLRANLGITHAADEAINEDLTDLTYPASTSLVDLAAQAGRSVFNLRTSISTLGRILGRIDYDASSAPTNYNAFDAWESTLNSLQFITGVRDHCERASNDVWAYVVAAACLAAALPHLDKARLAFDRVQADAEDCVSASRKWRKFENGYPAINQHSWTSLGNAIRFASSAQNSASQAVEPLLQAIQAVPRAPE